MGCCVDSGTGGGGGLLCANNKPSTPRYPPLGKPAVWVTRLSMLDCHLIEGVWYIYDWDTGWLVLMWWEASTGFSCMSFTR